eukprot:6466498-Amphidinium_carterae.1
MGSVLMGMWLFPKTGFQIIEDAPSDGWCLMLGNVKSEFVEADFWLYLKLVGTVSFCSLNSPNVHNPNVHNPATALYGAVN